MDAERFMAWVLVRLRGRGPYSGSAWRAAAHIYRDRAINCMEAMRSYQESIHVWEDSYDELERKNVDLVSSLARTEAVLSLLIEATCGGEVVTPNDALATAKPITWYESAGELSTMVVYGEANE